MLLPRPALAALAALAVAACVPTAAAPDACAPAGVSLNVWTPPVPRGGRPAASLAGARVLAFGRAPGTTTEGTPAADSSTPLPANRARVALSAEARGTALLAMAGEYAFHAIADPGSTVTMSLDGRRVGPDANVTVGAPPRVVAVELSYDAPPSSPPHTRGFALEWEFAGGGPSARGRAIPRGLVWADTWVSPGCRPA
jgi:hypothetical protein